MPYGNTLKLEDLLNRTALPDESAGETRIAMGIP